MTTQAQMAPLVSFIIPTHNRPQSLEIAVRSAFAAGQGADFGVEVIVVDDVSTDETPALCARLAEEFAAFSFVRNPTNQGPAGRNNGIAMARGKYLAFLDDDDKRLPGSLAAQIALLEAHPEAGLCYGPVLVANARMVPTGAVQPEKPLEGDLFWELLEENFIRVPSVVVRAQVLQEAGGFNPALRGTEDYDMWVRIAERTPCVAVPVPVAIYRQCDVTTEQLSADHAALIRSSAQLLEGWLLLPRAARAEDKQKKQVRRRFTERRVRLLRSTACQCLDAGMAWAARRDLRAAWDLDRGLARRLGVPRLWLRSWIPVKGKLRPRRKGAGS